MTKAQSSQTNKSAGNERWLKMKATEMSCG